ncbi:MAG: DUF4340 domain-containing protein [Spirochaetales bacterium]|nr:DUF4340 domain-containing protein [Spirochaetales bacterium]
MKIKKEYIAAAVIIVLSVLYLVFRSDSRVNYEIPEFSEVERDAVVSIIMTGQEGSIELKKEGDQWRMSPQGYRASVSEANRLVSEAVNLAIVDLISPRDDYSRYELDSDNAISVQVATIEGKVRDFMIGKTSSTSVYTYIRLPDRKGIYSVRGNLKSVFSPDTEKLRDRQVLNFNADEAASVELAKGGETVLFTRTAVTETPGWSRDGESLENSEEMDNHMKTLGMLKSTGFLEEEPAGEPQATVKITTPGGIHRLEVYEKQDKGYAARSSYVDDPFLIPFYIGDMILEL